MSIDFSLTIICELNAVQILSNRLISQHFNFDLSRGNFEVKGASHSQDFTPHHPKPHLWSYFTSPVFTRPSLPLEPIHIKFEGEVALTEATFLLTLPKTSHERQLCLLVFKKQAPREQKVLSEKGLYTV